MSPILDQFNVVVSLLPDPSIADTPRGWTVNGERGYRHAIHNCDKLRNATNVRTSEPSTPREEASRRPCPECFIDGFIRMNPLANVLRDLASVKRSLNTAAQRQAGELSLTDLYDTKGLLLRVGRGLERGRASDTAMDEYGPTIEELHSEQQRLLQENHDQVLKRAPEILHQVALWTMFPDRYQPTRSILTEEEARLLEGNGTSHWGQSELFDAWAGSSKKADDRTARERTLAYARANFHLSDLAQLNTITLPSTVNAGATLRKVAEDRWAQERDAVVSGLVDRWDATLAELLAKDTPTLAAVFEYGGGALHSQVISVFQTYARPDGKVTILRVPELIANWLQQDAKEPSYRRSMIALGNRVHLHTNEENHAVVETAATLWDPTQAGPYSTFSGAISAAAALLR